MDLRWRKRSFPEVGLVFGPGSGMIGAVEIAVVAVVVAHLIAGTIVCLVIISSYIYQGPA